MSGIGEADLMAAEGEGIISEYIARQSYRLTAAEAIVEMVASLMHFCSKEGMDYTLLLERASRSFEKTKSGNIVENTYALRFSEAAKALMASMEQIMFERWGRDWWATINNHGTEILSIKDEGFRAEIAAEIHLVYDYNTSHGAPYAVGEHERNKLSDAFDNALHVVMRAINEVHDSPTNSEFVGVYLDLNRQYYDFSVAVYDMLDPSGGQAHMCDNCRWAAVEEVNGTVADGTGRMNEIKHLGQRISPGGVVPSGECPACGSLCYPVELKNGVITYKKRGEG